jgi:hypothetical protein
LRASKQASVEDTEDNEPMHNGSTLDMDDDLTMEPTDDESGGEVRADAEEIELSMF